MIRGYIWFLPFFFVSNTPPAFFDPDVIEGDIALDACCQQSLQPDVVRTFLLAVVSHGVYLALRGRTTRLVRALSIAFMVFEVSAIILVVPSWFYWSVACSTTGNRVITQDCRLVLKSDFSECSSVCFQITGGGYWFITADHKNLLNPWPLYGLFHFIRHKFTLYTNVRNLNAVNWLLAVLRG